MPGALGFRSSNPSVLCITSLRASLDIFSRAGINNLRQKSILLTGMNRRISMDNTFTYRVGYLELLIDQHLSTTASHVTVITPRNPDERGCQLSFLVRESEGFDVNVLHSKLTNKGIVCDVRRPNVIRIAPAPLYLTHRFFSPSCIFSLRTKIQLI